MSMFDSLLGGGQQRQQFGDFIGRYEQGAPWDGIGDDEAQGYYQQVAGRVPPDVYQQSAEETFNRLSPEQRLEFGRYLRQQSRQRGMATDFDQDGIDDRFQDPRQLAQMTSRLDQQQPGILGQLLGGGTGGPGGGPGSMLSSPIGKAVLGGIAAMAAQRMMGGR